MHALSIPRSLPPLVISLTVAACRVTGEPVFNDTQNCRYHASIVSGDNQSAAARSTLAKPLEAAAGGDDGFFCAAALGAQFEWKVERGGGTITPIPGRWAATWTLGDSVGVQIVSATWSNMPGAGQRTVTFGATATAATGGAAPER